MRISDWSSDVCSSDLLPITLAAGIAGVWLFYVQHQFEDTYWARNAGWTAAEAALRGSSHYHLPGVLRWLTANIGIHHVHHLASRIPYYRLPRVLRDHPELAGPSRLTFLQSLGRSEEQRVGKECCSTCRSRWSPYHKKKKNT